ncbi:hypothetical protein Cadr_000031328 [Camelus dromedarius]|uniref:Olduvai domain-containing protein n=1 Tax=Camelus dromedarius TaxID=9838 RepID=A0A5N4BX88_CAMDR|nr:hypothetical protein Cadr_000031328 [Camelus dromedarius]
MCQNSALRARHRGCSHRIALKPLIVLWLVMIEVVLRKDKIDGYFWNLLQKFIEDEEDELEEEKLPTSIEQEELEEELLQESQDECVLNPSVLQEGSDCNRLDSEGNLPFDEEKVSRAPDVAGACSHVAEDPIPADLPGILSSFVPHTLSRLKKVFTEGRP